MDHVKRRGYRTGSEADHIDLGHEPPLSVDGETSNLIDRRRVSVQWFSGTILTGLCGAALMGGAVFASLDGQSNFATVPERVQLALRGSNERAATARKSDRLPPPTESNSQRRVIRDTQTSRVGNREIVRVRAFVRVASNLALSTSELSANIPAFNPLRMQAAEATNPGAAPTDESPDAEVDAEVSFVTADLANVLPKAKIAAVLSIDEVLGRVREAANWTGSAPSRHLSPELPRSARAYAAVGNVDGDPYAGFEARIAPENVTLLPKTQKEATGGTPWNERTVPVRKGETVASVLRELGARPDDIKAITAALGARGRDGGVRENHKLRVLLAPTDDPKFFQPIRVVIANDSAIEAVVAWSDLGRYVQVDIRNLETEVARARQQQEEEEDDGRGVRLYQSIYETALRNQVPRPLIEDIIRIYSYDIDFQRRVQPGDSFEILFAGEDEGADAKSEVLFAALTTGGETRRYYRFQSADDGLVDFYDETGKSAKKFLVRKPLADGIMRSGYGNRHHPLLRYTKMHTGVDWAAPMGTPIYASGNGTIEKLGWEGGYGRYIRIRHANGYQTAYGHMSAFARNMTEGKRVRQGQIIGYVGSTGLSTGAHLHYEIIVNGRTVDPMKFRLPRGRVLEGATLASFDTERDRLDNMISRAGPSRATPPRVAQTTR